MKETRSLTLVELVVVLALLVVVSTVALQSTERVVSQGRFDATTRQLETVRFAMLGPEFEYDRAGVRLLSGFAVDFGRFPLVNRGGADGEELSELWLQGGLVSYGEHTASGLNATVAQDSEVKLTYGWRGPYLSFPIAGKQQVVDGWGNELSYLEPGNNYVGSLPNSTPDGSEAVRIVSRGGLGVLDPDPPADEPEPFERDIPLHLDDFRITINVDVTIRASDVGDQILIVLYEANDTDAPAAVVLPITPTSPPEVQSVSFSSRAPGHKVIRGYRVSSAFTGPQYDFDLTTGVVKSRSQLAPVTSRSFYQPLHRVEIDVP